MKIRTKLLSLILLLSILPIIIVGYLVFVEARYSIVSQLSSSLKTVVELKESEVVIYLKNLKMRVVDYSLDRFVFESFSSGHNPDSTDTLFQQKLLSDYLIKYKVDLDSHLEEIDIVDLDGNVFSSSNPSRIGESDKGLKYFIEGQKKTYVQDVHMMHFLPPSHDSAGHDQVERHSYIEEPHIAISTPIYDPDLANIVGVLVAHFNIKLLNDIMSGSYLSDRGRDEQFRGIGTTGETYLVNHDYLFLNDSLFFDGAIFKKHDRSVPVQSCIDNVEEHTGIWVDYRGVEVVGASECVKFNNFMWVLISKQDLSEAFLPIINIQNILFVSITILSLIVFVLALFLGSRITSPIKELIKASNIFSTGDLDYKININSKDEIGELSRTFDSMAKKLSVSQKELKLKNREMNKKIDEHERLNKLMIGRELKMIELKKGMKRLYKK